MQVGSGHPPPAAGGDQVGIANAHRAGYVSPSCTPNRLVYLSGHWTMLAVQRGPFDQPSQWGQLWDKGVFGGRTKGEPVDTKLMKQTLSHATPPHQTFV